MMNFEEYPEEYRKDIATRVLGTMKDLPLSDKVTIIARMMQGLGGHKFWWFREGFQYITSQGKISWMKVVLEEKLPHIRLEGNLARVYEEVYQIMTHPESTVSEIMDS